jgi:hypothetical protein
MKRLLDALLDTVQPRKAELTFDLRGYSLEQRAAVISAAAARGLHVSGYGRWILVRDLRTEGK